MASKGACASFAQLALILALSASALALAGARLSAGHPAEGQAPALEAPVIDSVPAPIPGAERYAGLEAGMVRSGDGQLRNHLRWQEEAETGAAVRIVL